MEKAENKRRIDPEYVRIMTKGVIKLSIFIALMFFAAGRINYWQGWLFSGILFIMRTYLEDKTLQKELPGYTDYIKKVKYRLIPGIW